MIHDEDNELGSLFRSILTSRVYEVVSETPLETARRELQEEVGQSAGRLEELGWIWTSPGFAREKIHLYAAFDLTDVAARPEDDEVIEVIPTSLDDALEAIWAGEITDAKSANRSSPRLSATASRSRTVASSERSVYSRSDNPVPLAS